MGMAVMLITHDLGVVSEMADRVVVMYAGRVMEQGPYRSRSLRQMRHPYTRGLVNSIPNLEEKKEETPRHSRPGSGCHGSARGM